MTINEINEEIKLVRNAKNRHFSQDSFLQQTFIKMAQLDWSLFRFLFCHFQTENLQSSAGFELE